MNKQTKLHLYDADKYYDDIHKWEKLKSSTYTRFAEYSP